jgi:hypothetical protein
MNTALEPDEYDAILDVLDAMEAESGLGAAPAVRGILVEVVLACWPTVSGAVADELRTAPTASDAELEALHQRFEAEHTWLADLVIVPLGQELPPLPPDRIERMRFATAAAIATLPSEQIGGLARWVDHLLDVISGEEHPTLRRLVGAASRERIGRAVGGDPQGQELIDLAIADGTPEALAVLGDWLDERGLALAHAWVAALALC